MYSNSDANDDEDFDGDFMFNEYAMDDTLDSLSRLEKYYNSDFPLQRLVLVREVYDTTVESGYEDSVKRLIPLLPNFVADPEPAVRQVFAEQLHSLATYFVENAQDPEAGYYEVINTFIPYTFELIIDKNVEVAQAATEALLKIAELIKKEHIEPQILNVVRNLSHDEKVEEYRIAAAKLCNELAPVFGERLCKEVIFPEVNVLAEDPSLLVRKTVAQHLGKICTVVGVDFTVHKILPMYLNLAKDEIWGVRKACAESLPHISQAVTSEARTKQLLELFEAFADDVSRWVKMEAYKQLGPFIATFKTHEVSKSLIQSFTEMAYQSDQGDSDMVEYCAFTFPAVTLTVGREKWSLLENAFSTLVKDNQWKVRKSLAYSLHEIAIILGTELTESSLMEAFELFLKDLEEVRIGMVSNLSKFVKVLSEPTRIKVLPLIYSIPNETENWRIKCELGKQLGEIAQLFEISYLKSHILKLLYSLLNDPFAEVRIVAIESCGKILKQLDSDETTRMECIDSLCKLSKGKFFIRQLFAKACNYIIKEIDPTLFENYFLPCIMDLSKDVVPNVRMAVASFVNNTLLFQEYFSNHEKVLQLQQQLKQDTDRDVQFCTSSLLQ